VTTQIDAVRSARSPRRIAEFLSTLTEIHQAFSFPVSSRRWCVRAAVGLLL